MTAPPRCAVLYYYFIIITNNPNNNNKYSCGCLQMTSIPLCTGDSQAFVVGRGKVLPGKDRWRNTFHDCVRIQPQHSGAHVAEALCRSKPRIQQINCYAPGRLPG